MHGFDTKLTDEINFFVQELEQAARDAGLEPCTTIFELVDYKQLNEIAAYLGFPTRYPHWRFGMEYERLAKSYTYGLAIIYEMVINNNPCYAYLLRANDLVYQKTVIAHVYGHCDFFQKNYWFSKTNGKMLNQMANHGTIVRSLINEIGHDKVESFLDCCLSLENLIDIYAPFQTKTKKKDDHTAEEINITDDELKLDAKSYMDTYVNPKEYIARKRKLLEEKHSKDPLLDSKTNERDVLNYLLCHAPLQDWEWQLLDIIRAEAYYFAPQAQTKILNEGWATYWHSKMMTKLYPLSAAEIIDYCDHYAGVVASVPGQLNPYKLGVELLRHCERRWDEGRFGLEYLNCTDPKVRKLWNKNTQQGQTKLFEIRKIHNDVSFIDAYLDEDFCYEQKMLIYDYDRNRGKYVISSREFAEVKRKLLDQLTNVGNPIIAVKDGNFRNRSELLLVHEHSGQDLKQDFALETLKSLLRLWKRPVHLETRIEGVSKRISCSGSDHQIERI